MTSQGPCAAPARLRRLVLCTALFAALSGTASAVDLTYEAGLSLLHSDNLNLAEVDEIEEDVLSPRLRFEAEENGSTVQLKARGEIAYLDYLGDEFDDEFRGSLAGQFNWTLMPERINFVVEDYLSNQPVNILNSFSPTNQQEVNVFVAGPSFYARFDDATRGQFDLRYSKSRAEETDEFDGDRFNGAARVIRQLSARDLLSLTAEGTKVEFDDAAANTDYRRFDVYFGYTRELQNLDFGLDLGYTRLEITDSGEREGSPLVRGNVEWEATPRSTFNADFSQQFADAADDLVTRAGNLDGPIISDISTADVLVGPSVFRQKRIELGYQYTGERVTFQARPQMQKIRYDDPLTPDQQSHGGYFQLDYKVMPRTTISFLAAQDTREFDDLSRTDKDFTANIGLKHEFTRHWIGRVDLQHRKRDSSIALQSYNENAIIFAFSYVR